MPATDRPWGQLIAAADGVAGGSNRGGLKGARLGLECLEVLPAQLLAFVRQVLLIITIHSGILRHPTDPFMDANQFAKADPLLDELSESLDKELTGPAFSDVGKILERIRKVFGERYSVSLSVVVDLFDDKEERSLPLLTTGLSTTAGKAPFRTYGDSSPQRYIVDGSLVVVPHDRCPKCWGVWDFKFLTRSCEHCGAELGGNCKVLLDSDVCPSCERGRVSITQPKCDSCGFEVDPQMVTWG